MEWTEALKRSISYMEAHLLDNIDGCDVVESVNISPYYFQKGFSLVTGYTVAEYLRNRRLYLAAIDVVAGREKVIDIACRYGYDTPESFTKAFTRFHGLSPLQLKGDSSKIKPFLPLTVIITIQGGNDMDFTVEKMDVFKVIGFLRDFSFETSYQEIPKFWSQFMEQCCKRKSDRDVQAVVESCCVGEFGVCIDDLSPAAKKFRYMIAGKYNGGPVPLGMDVFEIPASEWAKFRCVGPLPGALQSVNTEVFKNWLPGNPDYKMSFPVNIEWYSMGDGSASDYESGIWVPVRKL